MRKKIFLVISEEDTICPECGSPLCRRDRKLRVHKEAGDEYRSLLDDIKTAKYRIETLEYVVEKTNYFDNSEIRLSIFMTQNLMIMLRIWDSI